MRKRESGVKKMKEEKSGFNFGQHVISDALLLHSNTAVYPLRNGEGCKKHSTRILNPDLGFMRIYSAQIML